MATHADIVLAAIEAAIEARLSGGAVVSSSVDGVSLARATLAELYDLRLKYNTEVALESATDTDAFGRASRVVFPNFSSTLMET